MSKSMFDSVIFDFRLISQISLFYSIENQAIKNQKLLDSFIQNSFTHSLIFTHLFIYSFFVTMKNIILILALTLSFFACDSFTTTNTNKPTTTTGNDRTIVETSDNPVTQTLLNMRQKEQALQAKINEISDKFGDEQALFELDEQQQKMYVEHMAKLEEVMGSAGWISSKKYGKTACEQALTIMKNAPGERLENHLDVVLKAAENDEANPEEVAYIHDKVLMHQGKKQLYGTQIAFNEKKGINDVYPIEDEANVDTRRAKVGLEPLADALKKMGIKY